MSTQTSVLVPQLEHTMSFDPSGLPTYNTLSLPDFPLDLEVNELDAALPAYQPPEGSGNRNTSSASRRLVEHKFTLPDSKGREWLSLRVGSLAQSSTALPNFYEGVPITGVVELKLEKPDSISAIIISINGAVVVSAIDIKPFLALNQTLWDGTFGDPRIPQSASEPRSEIRSAKFTGKLLGSYSFPFSLQVPHETNVSRTMLKDLQLTKHVPLPPHLSERGCFSLIDYNLIVTVKRSGLFRVSDTLTTRFGYTPRSRPESPSPLRQLSYQENIPVLGPSLDPDGWILFPPVNIKGTLFGSREVHVDCVFGLAKPLAYTRGCAIPCSLMIECEDPQLFDLLSSRNSGILQLFRAMNTRVLLDVGGRNAADATPTSDTPISESSWFPPDATSPPPDANGPRGRTLLGEISIPSDARPSFTFGQSYVKYIVRLVPSEVPGFVPAGKRFPEVCVEVNTDYPIGPRPRSYLPPSYRRNLPHRFDAPYIG